MQKANFFVLTGDHLQVVYSATSLTGQPLLHYQDAHLVKNFTGDDIRRVETDLGELVSVTLNLTPDAGSTTFTLIVPHVNVESGAARIRTQGLRTIHRFSIAPQLLRGQLESSTVVTLHGSAEFVVS